MLFDVLILIFYGVTKMTFTYCSLFSNFYNRDTKILDNL